MTMIRDTRAARLLLRTVKYIPQGLCLLLYYTITSVHQAESAQHHE